MQSAYSCNRAIREYETSDLNPTVAAILHLNPPHLISAGTPSPIAGDGPPLSPPRAHLPPRCLSLLLLPGASACPPARETKGSRRARARQGRDGLLRRDELLPVHHDELLPASPQGPAPCGEVWPHRGRRAAAVAAPPCRGGIQAWTRATMGGRELHGRAAASSSCRAAPRSSSAAARDGASGGGRKDHRRAEDATASRGAGQPARAGSAARTHGKGAAARPRAEGGGPQGPALLATPPRPARAEGAGAAAAAAAATRPSSPWLARVRCPAALLQLGARRREGVGPWRVPPPRHHPSRRPCARAERVGEGQRGPCSAPARCGEGGTGEEEQREAPGREMRSRWGEWRTVPGDG
ncbi:hypothetical protein PVAP13_9KG491726 [Panicum virgatum]|uniref:Uncharacterized protein n=1 Tax=Panicum virgatum TaxID=38727 RepID=A0A8T0NY47_PANVG|nr:hypothetical protein PVAP13_9KG491726 [Panicum virgatum]